MKRIELLTELQKRQREIAGVRDVTADTSLRAILERMLRDVERTTQSMGKLDLNAEATPGEAAALENSARVFEIVMASLRQLPPSVQMGVADRLYFYLQVEGLNVSVVGGGFAEFFQHAIREAIRSRDESLLRPGSETAFGCEDFLFFTIGVTDIAQAWAIATEELKRAALDAVVRIAIFEPETNAFRVLSEDPRPIPFEDCLSRVDDAIKRAFQ